jgi:hypothetical protein
VALPPTIGLADMRAIVLAAAGADARVAPAGGVFQYLGELDRPGMIGRVDRGGRWIKFDLYREAVWTSATERWTPYRALAGAAKAEADALIDLWARQRWLHRLDAGRGGS